MTQSTRFQLMLVGVLVFTIGILVGQQTQRSKFDKYLQPGTVTFMQFATLSAEVEAIRDHFPNDDSGIGVPEFGFDPATHSFTAYVLVNDDLTKKPIARVRPILLGVAEFWLNHIQRYIPEVSKETFRVKYGDFSYSAIKDSKQRDFAEYVNGELILK